MSDNYVEGGYVEDGYVEGDGASLDLPDGAVKMNFFVSSGSQTETALLEEVKGALGEEEIAIVYLPESRKTILSDPQNHFEFNGNLNVDEVISIVTNSAEVMANIVANLLGDTNFITSLSEALDINMSVSIRANDGSIVANATVVQTDPNSFEVTVPPEIVGTDYKIVFDR